MASSGQTFFPIMTAVGTSASIPVVFEEMKPRQMQKQYKDQIQNLFRSNYSGDVNARGAVNKDKGQSELGVTDFNNSAPLVFVLLLKRLSTSSMPKPSPPSRPISPLPSRAC